MYVSKKWKITVFTIPLFMFMFKLLYYRSSRYQQIPTSKIIEVAIITLLSVETFNLDYPISIVGMKETCAYVTWRVFKLSLEVKVEISWFARSTLAGHFDMPRWFDCEEIKARFHSTWRREIIYEGDFW